MALVELGRPVQAHRRPGRRQAAADRGPAQRAGRRLQGLGGRRVPPHHQVGIGAQRGHVVEPAHRDALLGSRRPGRPVRRWPCRRCVQVAGPGVHGEGGVDDLRVDLAVRSGERPRRPAGISGRCRLGSHGRTLLCAGRGRVRSIRSVPILPHRAGARDRPRRARRDAGHTGHRRPTRRPPASGVGRPRRPARCRRPRPRRWRARQRPEFGSQAGTASACPGRAPAARPASCTTALSTTSAGRSGDAQQVAGVGQCDGRQRVDRPAVRAVAATVGQPQHVAAGAGQLGQPWPFRGGVGQRLGPHARGVRGHQHTGAAGRGVQPVVVDHQRADQHRGDR